MSELYVLPNFHFSYDGLDWIRPLPAGLMHIHFVVLAILGLMVAVGFCYRVAILLFFLGFTYVELVDQTAYLNHYYLVSLLSGLMIFLPAHRAWSVDAWCKPTLKLDNVPIWTLHLLRFQIAVVYIFAGLAKVNADWLLSAQPLRIWLAARSDLPLIGPWLDEVWVAYAASWFSAFYDLSIVFFLLCRRTRIWAFLAVIVFHVGTWILFNIGMFPWIMIAATTVFFRPDWPRLCFGRLVEKATKRFHFKSWPQWTTSLLTGYRASRTCGVSSPRFVAAMLVLYAAAQVILPLRPYLFNAGHPAWSYRGFNLSWQVLVAEKTGYVEFYARDGSTGRRTRIKTRDYITPRQELLMAQDPYLIRKLARKISADLQAHEGKNPEIVVDAFATINGRPSQRIIDPKADLVGQTGYAWILPLKF